ncbi:MAG TPA: polysaccharide biosynthesis/export family protein [Phnomibacter sp.]|nr:polysaccharide biosynthesis/export family protein [Phnomibacter sp.]
MRSPRSILLLSVSLLLFLASCKNSKQLAYFQDLSDTSRVQAVQLAPHEPLRLQPDDQVQITISSTSPEAAQFFNLMTATPVAGVAGIGVTGANMPSQSFANVYAVNQLGHVSLPVLGDLTVVGLSTEELKAKISGELKDYLKDAVVAVRLTNFKVTVIGDVQKPIVVPVEGERINVLEALGAAGDMTVYANRFNVKVVRKTGNQMEVAHLNFNTSKAMQSPYFQLRQNDVIYVEPNKNKGMLGESWQIWVPVVTSFLSLLIVAITSAR